LYKLGYRKIGVRFLAGAEFSFLQSVVQTGSGAPTASYPSTKVLSLGSKLQGRESRSHASIIVEVKNVWSYIIGSPYMCIVWFFIDSTGNFAFIYNLDIACNIVG
jgi:hypothetical protein